MAWKDSLLDASFREVSFHVKSSKDSAKRSLIEHSYPYRNGAELEDNGLNARRIQLVAVFWGDAYESALQRFISALDEGGQGELIHPVFGSLPVMVESYEIPHEAERPDYVEVTISLVEAGRENPFFNREFNPVSQAESQGEVADAAMKQASSVIGQELAGRISEIARSLDIAKQLEFLDEAASLISGYQAVKNAVLSGLNYLDFPAALLSDLQTVIDETAFADLGGGIFSGWRRLSDMFARLSLDKAGVKTSYPSVALAYKSPAASLASVSAAPSSNSQAYFPGPLSQGQAALRATANCEQTRALTAAAGRILTQEALTPSLSPAEVEAIVGNCRRRIQDSIDEIRLVYGPGYAYTAALAVVETLRDAALAVQEQGTAVINLRPPLTRYQNQRLRNLHLLAHELYGDYQRADEIRRLNPGLRRPNFVAQGTELNIYAQ